MYNGPERRKISEDREGRRIGDQRCPDHYLLWKHHDEDKATFRDNVSKDQSLACSKIKTMEAYHNKDMEELKKTLDNKANLSDIRGLVKLVSFLVGICCLIVAGQAIWLKTDISGITNSVQRLHGRITEVTNERTKTDMEQISKLESIDGKLGTVNWRLNQIEENHKANNKLIPNK